VADEQVIKLLEEIRDLQKAHMANYKEAVKNQQESIAIQKSAVRRQTISIPVIVVVVVGSLLFLAFLLRH
jgi:type II secretory pathway component HofQ